MVFQWRARAGEAEMVVVEYRGPSGGAWEPVRVIDAASADDLGRQLREAAQETRRRAQVTRLDNATTPAYRGGGAALEG